MAITRREFLRGMGCALALSLAPVRGLTDHLPQGYHFGSGKLYLNGKHLGQTIEFTIHRTKLTPRNRTMFGRIEYDLQPSMDFMVNEVYEDHLKLVLLGEQA